MFNLFYMLVVLINCKSWVVFRKTILYKSSMWLDFSPLEATNVFRSDNQPLLIQLRRSVSQGLTIWWTMADARQNLLHCRAFTSFLTTYIRMAFLMHLLICILYCSLYFGLLYFLYGSASHSAQLYDSRRLKQKLHIRDLWWWFC